MGATKRPVKKHRLKRWWRENLFSMNEESLTIELKVMMAPRPTDPSTAMNW